MIKDTNIPQGYKDSPLGIIPKDWEVKRLGKVCEIDKESLSSNTNPNYEFDYISLSDIDSESFQITTTKQIFRNAPSRARRIVKKGDVIISTVRPNLKTFILIKDVVKDLIVSTGFAVLTPQKVIGDYLYQYMFSTQVTKQFYHLVVGSNYPAVNSSDVSHLRIAIPRLEEQQLIASVLQLWDTAIEKQSKLINKLTVRKRALMQQLLTGKKRLPRFKEDWKDVKLGDIFDERNETNCDNLLLLSITGDKGVIYQSDSDKRDISNNDKSKYKRICPNDIGYNTMRMWQGRSALSDLEGIVSPAYTIVTPKESVDVRFMAMLIKQSRVVYDFWTHSQGLVSDTLNCKFSDFCQVKVRIPVKQEQIAIADLFQKTDKEIELAKEKSANLQSQKRGLMQQLLTGKKRVKS